MILFFYRLYVHPAFSKVGKKLQKRTEREFCSSCEVEKEKKSLKRKLKVGKGFFSFFFFGLEIARVPSVLSSQRMEEVPHLFREQ